MAAVSGGANNGLTAGSSTAEAMEKQPTQENLSSTVSWMQSIFQQEVERANRLTKTATEENTKSLVNIQRKVDDRLQEMDETIKIIHEGQTSNDTNIQIMMTKMDLFSAQM